MTDKIPPRPKSRPAVSHEDAYAMMREQMEWCDAVAKVAVEALRETPCLCSSLLNPRGKWDCPRCEALRQIKSSGWTP